MKFTTNLNNYVSSAKWNKVKLTHHKNHTTNSTISTAIFKRECEEYDTGVLPTEHELCMGERI